MELTSFAIDITGPFVVVQPMPDNARTVSSFFCDGGTVRTFPSMIRFGQWRAELVPKREPDPVHVGYSRARIEGTYKGQKWVYEDPPGSQGSLSVWSDGSSSDYWWAEGNGSCDCNRVRYFDPERKVRELYNLPDCHSDDPDPKCGTDICIDRIISLDGKAPDIILDETGTIRN